MLTHYLTLGLNMNTDDNAIRQRYLELVKIHTPETDPVRFRRITTAYEALKDERRRIESDLFGYLNQPDYDKELLRLAQSRPPKRRRAGLKELIASAEKLV